MLCGRDLLTHSLDSKILQARFDLLVHVSTTPGVSVDGQKHPHNPAAFLAFAAGIHAFVVLMCCVTGNLMVLQMRIPLNQCFLYQHLGQRTQDRELAGSPAFLHVVPGKRLVEVAALIVEAVVVGDALVGRAVGGVVLVSDDDPTDAPFSHQRQRPEQENSDGPETNGIFVRTDAGEVLANERHLAQHPGKQPVGVDPYPGRVGNLLLEMAICVERGEPVATGFVDEYGMCLATDLIQQPEA